MKVLLDTHALLWWFADDPRLSASAREVIANVDNEIWVSAASAWEVASKARIGKLAGAARLLSDFDAIIAGEGFKPRPRMNGLRKKWPRAGVKSGVLAALPPKRLIAEWLCHRPGKLYPAHTPELCAQKSAAIVDNAKAIAEYRSRLTHLSWLMKSFSEPIARKANAEDKVMGRFWEG